MAAPTVLFIHGLFMTPLCWEHWIPLAEARGYRCLAPGYPGRDRPVEELRSAHPDPQLGRLTLTQVVDHYAGIIASLESPPVIIGHSMGGLITQLLVQRGIAAAGVAVNSAPPMGVFSFDPNFLRSNWPLVNPFLPPGRPITMPYGRFCTSFMNGHPEEQRHYDFERYIVPESRRIPRDSITARIDFSRPHAPLLFIGGGMDAIIPPSLNRKNHVRYTHTGSVTEYKEFSARTHSIILQSGWEEVVTYVFEWIARHHRR